MTKTEKAIRDFCGHCSDWWPSATQVQAMLALAQPCTTCEALARTVMLDQTSHDTKRPWVDLTDGDWEWVADKKETSLDTFAHGAAWAADQLKEKNT